MMELRFSYRLWLLPLALTVLLLVLLTLGGERQSPSERVPPVVLGDGDTTNETLNTLVAQVDALDRRLGELRAHMDAYGAHTHDNLTQNTVPELSDAHEHRWRALNHSVQTRLEQLEQRIERGLSLPVVETSTPALPVLGSRVDAPTGSSAAGTQGLASYTVPAGTILFGALALTALVGKIPTDGSLESPFPVKVLVGDDNVVPGGKNIPALKGMLLSGIAIGDRALKCVTVNLTQVHFVFEDGSIASGESSHQGEQVVGSHLPSGDDGVGWLSDPAGVPCIPGALLSGNQSAGVATVLRGAALGFARGLQQSELSEIASVEGNVLRALSGDSEDYSRASALAGALGGEYGAAIDGSTVADVIYVPPGAKVIAHVSRQIILDHHSAERQIIHRPKDAAVANYVYPD